MTKLTHAEIADIVKVVNDAIANAGTTYVHVNYPFFEGLAAPVIQTLAHQAAIYVVNALVEKGKLP